jgi:hypothetical protein
MLITYKTLSPEVKEKLKKLNLAKEKVDLSLLLLRAYKLKNPNTKFEIDK